MNKKAARIASGVCFALMLAILVYYCIQIYTGAAFVSVKPFSLALQLAPMVGLALLAAGQFSGVRALTATGAFLECAVSVLLLVVLLFEQSAERVQLITNGLSALGFLLLGLCPVLPRASLYLGIAAALCLAGQAAVGLFLAQQLSMSGMSSALAYANQILPVLGAVLLGLGWWKKKEYWQTIGSQYRRYKGVNDENV